MIFIKGGYFLGLVFFYTKNTFSCTKNIFKFFFGDFSTNTQIFNNKYIYCKKKIHYKNVFSTKKNTNAKKILLVQKKVFLVQKKVLVQKKIFLVQKKVFLVQKKILTKICGASLLFLTIVSGIF